MLSSVSIPQSFAKNLPLFLIGGILFDDNPLSGPSVSENGFNATSTIILSCRKNLSLFDIQCVVMRYATYIESPQASFRTSRKMITVLTQLVPVLKEFVQSNRDEVRRAKRRVFRCSDDPVPHLPDVRAQAGGSASDRGARGRGGSV